MERLCRLINVIKNAYDLSELFDININITKKNPECPDSISNYLENFRTKFSLSTQNQYDNEISNITYDVTVFGYFSEKNKNVIHQIHLGTFLSRYLYSNLEKADFFENTDMFAISIVTPSNAYPRIYVYITK